MNARRAGLVALVAAPAVVSVVVAAVTYVRAPAHVLYAEGRLWLAVLGTGLVLSAGLAVPMVWRWQLVRARAHGAGEAREAASRDHHRFLLRLDHELKNPITAMRAALANLPDSVAPSLLGDIAAQTQRLADLVSDLRKLAELETRPIERAPVDLAELLAEVRELSDLDGRSITVTLPQAPWPLGSVPGDRDLLFLALHNLLSNASKFTRPGDRIELRARDEGDQVVVEVADTGQGIPADEIGQVWEELARGRAARGTPGMGLGLALVRAVVARHGGTVSIRSREGHGTVVAARLPAGPP